MPFNAPATIPNVHYRDAPYGYPEYLSYPSSSHLQHPFPANAPIVPPPNTILYDQLYNSDHLRVRCHIRQLLKHNEVTALPVGFPFRCVSSGGSARISHSSYEFKETLYLNDERETRVQEATFVYTSPDRSANGMMSWQIFLSARGSEIREYSNARRKLHLPRKLAQNLIILTFFFVARACMFGACGSSKHDLRDIIWCRPYHQSPNHPQSSRCFD